MNRFAIFLLTVGVFLTATSELVVSGILPVIAKDMDISIALAGQLITAFSLAFAIGTPILVALTSRMGRKQVLTGALIVYILGSLLAFVSSHFWLLMVSRVILGISAGVYLVVAFGAVAKLVPAEKIGSSIGTVILGFSTAMVLGVPIGIVITDWLNWSAIFMILGLLSFGVMLVFIRHFPEVEGDAPIPFAQQVKVLGSMVVISGLFLTFFRESGNSAMFTYMTPFLQTIYQMNAATIGLVMLGLGLFGVIGSRLGGYVVDKWGAARMIVVGSAAHVVALGLLPLVTASVGGGLALIALMVFAMFATAPAIQTYFIQQAPQSANLILSLNTSIVHVGLAAGAGMGGVMINSTSTTLYNPWLAGGVIALGLGAALVSFSRKAQTVSKAV
ncbi:MAG TPA: MFS transporter [Candidatus Bathyarchaeia archaeon]|nr:MFS transporter [Candidatus Bathyarchaeia archaeon]